MATRSQRSKLVLKDLGEPAMVKAQPENVMQYALGTLVGIATGFIERTDPKEGTIFEGLSGTFRSIPSDETKDELESGVLFIPDAFHNLVAATLRDLLKTDPNAQVKFAFEISSIRAKNPAGYSWNFKPMIESESENPLDAFIGSVGKLQIKDGRKVLALAAPADAAKTAPKK